MVKRGRGAGGRVQGGEIRMELLTVIIREEITLPAPFSVNDKGLIPLIFYV